MATIEELTQALMQADQAGDSEAASVIAEQIQQMQGTVAAPGSYADTYLAQGTTGFNEGLAAILGLPTDLAQGAINLGIKGTNAVAGTDIQPLSASPFTSAWIQSQMQKGNMISPPSADGKKRVTRRVGREVGAAAPLAAGVIAKGGQVINQGMNATRNATLGGQLEASAARTAANPGRFLTTDALAAGGAGVAGGTSQELLPGNQYADLAASLAGGMTPAGVVSVMRSPDLRAFTKVQSAANGVPPRQAADEIDALGPEGMVIDVLGARGASLGRGAANVNPDARQTLEDAINARKAGQNQRLVDDISSAAGVDPGLRRTADDIKAENFAAVRPQINRAYEEARQIGYDLPRTPFEDILNSPLGKKAYDQAAESLLNRKAVDGIDATSELARLDETKRILDSIASTAYRSGDNNLGSQASDLSKALRARIDESIAGPAYSEARRLRSDAYKADEAVDLGTDLARPTVAIDAPIRANRVNPENRSAMAEAYAASKAQQLLNKNNKPGDFLRMTSTLGREAYKAALGPRASIVDEALRRETTFNKTDRDLTGGSTTARQLNDNTLGDNLAAGALTIADPSSGGLMGLLRGAGRVATGGVQRRRRFKEAPYIADYLTRQTLPRGLQERVLNNARREELLLGLLAARTGGGQER